jgi:putative lipoprotein
MRFCFAFVLGLFLVVSPALAAKVTLSGQVTYRERIALPETATLEIQLVDQTLPSLPPRLDVKAPIGPGQVPLSFNLGFEDSLILPSHTYALVATIAVPEGVMFRNAEPYALNPLAPAQPLLITVNRFATDHDQAAASSEPAPTDTAAPAILDATWTAVSIKGAAVLPRNHPTLSIGADLRAGGSTGCNSWFAQAELHGDALHLGQIGATLIACPEPVTQQEKAFTEALSQSARWQIVGDSLTLFGVDGMALLTFTR